MFCDTVTHLTDAVLALWLQLSLELQYYACELVKSLLRTERNQQVMCEAGLPSDVLTYCAATLANERHALHSPLQYVFERLAAQSLTPRDLRFVAVPVRTDYMLHVVLIQQMIRCFSSL